MSTAVNKPSENVSKKVGDKIIELLQRNKKETPMITTQERQGDQPMSDYEINERLNRILSGGKLRRMKII